LLIVLSILLSYGLRSNIIISGLTFLGINIINLFSLLLFAVSALNLENYALLKDAHAISVDEFIALEKKARVEEQKKITNQNSKSEKLKKAEEKYNL